MSPSRRGYNETSPSGHRAVGIRRTKPSTSSSASGIAQGHQAHPPSDSGGSSESTWSRATMISMMTTAQLTAGSGRVTAGSVTSVSSTLAEVMQVAQNIAPHAALWTWESVILAHVGAQFEEVGSPILHATAEVPRSLLFQGHTSQEGVARVGSAGAAASTSTSELLPGPARLFSTSGQLEEVGDRDGHKKRQET